MRINNAWNKKYSIVLLFIIILTTLIFVKGNSDSSSLPADTISLDGPYVDWSQQEIPFGWHSYQHAPWRAYMDTRDSSNFLEALGVVFNPAPEEADAVAQLLAEAGIVSARVEIGWGALDFEDDKKINQHQQEDMLKILKALRKHKIRPLILLNSHSGSPAPGKTWETTLVKPANAGDTELYLKDSKSIVPHYTGLQGIAQFMYPIFTAIDHKNGRATLSAPLPKALPAEMIKIAQLKYRPFSGEIYSDGRNNISAQETLDGWMRYVQTVTSFVKGAMGTEGLNDAGFDVEVWNELSFGYHFLDINEYYDPPISFSQELTYSIGDKKEEGSQVIFPLTAEYITDPVNNLPGVKVINGFANQRPWDNGAGLWPGQAGFSRHYYTNWHPVGSDISPNNTSLKTDKMLNARGEPDQQGFIPEHISAFPERWFYAYQTEYVVRDLQPFPGPWKDHFRFSHPGNGVPAEVWMTESNLYRGLFAKQLANLSNVNEQDPRIAKVMHHIGTKTTMRNYIFQSHKGIKTINLYAAKASDNEFALLPEAFYSELERANYELTNKVRAKAGPQIIAIQNIVRLMKLGENIEQPRFINIENITTYDEALAYEGNESLEASGRNLIEDIAVLPYQLQNDFYAIAYYIVTRDLTQTWESERDVLDPLRYDMPEKYYEVTISNIAGEGAELTIYDPLEDSSSKIEILESTETTLTVRLPAADYPRFLLVKEKELQPLIIEPEILVLEGETKFSFTPTVSGEVVLQWGAYPLRNGGGFKEIAYTDDLLQDYKGYRELDHISVNDLPAKKSSYEWKGKIEPKYSEEYTFIIESDSCQVTLWINNKQVIDECSSFSRGQIVLEAGRSYELKATFRSPYNHEHHIAIYWASKNQPREVVAPISDKSSQTVKTVNAGEKFAINIPELLPREAIKLYYTSKHGIQTQYPHWNYDIRGVYWGEDSP
ncbi:PA14 domain-containing protein [Paenibacillus daejeonensis]|uniref:PA14 domain-containing protein n=1 Tax=Paenibacillus daejeonensis TaxID=135193 RepID=UPI000369F907|nr:PA14 domain-containing protein [Paenibacillus daejeonensis]